LQGGRGRVGKSTRKREREKERKKQKITTKN